MKIGIDIDGVILDTEKQFRNGAELYDITELKRNSLINNKALHIQQRFDWTEEEKTEFITKKLLELTKKSNVIPGAKEVIDLLKKDGHELIVISARGGDKPVIPGMIEAAEEIMNKAEIKFDKYYWKIKNKIEICQKENIDIMIEDSLHNCQQLAEANIKTIYLRDSNMEESNHENIKEVYIWSEIYRHIKSISK